MADEAAQPPASEDSLSETRRLLEDAQPGEALAYLSTLHAADQAKVIAQLDSSLRAPMLARVAPEMMAEILVFLRDEARRRLVDELAPDRLAPLLDQVDRDVAADILRGMEADPARDTLATMTTAAAVQALMPHADETAGGRMTSDYVSLHQAWTVDEALVYLRKTKPDVEQAYYLYVVDDGHHLEGVVSLRHLVIAAPEERIAEVMTPEIVSAGVAEDQEEVARRVQRYNFIALPVVDDEGCLVGVINVDDVLDVAEEEATEDMYRMAGLVESESLLRPIARSLAPRLGWLLIALASVFVAAAVVNAFEDTIQRVVVLAVIMPIIVALGGNAGVQTITLVVRSLALGTIELRDVRHILRRELIIGVTNGVVIGVLLGLAAYAWKGNVWLGVVAGTAMLLSMTTGVLAGVLVPVLLRTLRLDPALASGVLVTTVTDVLGFFFFLGLATLLVDRLA